jgi:hypothetical protein
MIDHVANRDKVSKAKAAATARKEYPRLFSSYQASVGCRIRIEGWSRTKFVRATLSMSPAQEIGYAYPGLARAGTNDLNTGWRRECPSTIENYIAISKACERVGFRTHKPTPN